MLTDKEVRRKVSNILTQTIEVLTERGSRLERAIEELNPKDLATQNAVFKSGRVLSDAAFKITKLLLVLNVKEEELIEKPE